MPEVLTKHPDVVKQVLESAGARCGKGSPQKILKKCRPESFCLLPGGEMCVYGTGELAQMTQLKTSEVCANAPPASASIAYVGGGAMAAALLGYAIGSIFMKFRKRDSSHPTCR